MPKIDLYYNNEIVNDDKSIKLESFKKMLLRDFKESETLEFYPFNYFGEQDTSFKEPCGLLHNKRLVVSKITKIVVNDWNNECKLMVKIYLSDLKE